MNTRKKLIFKDIVEKYIKNLSLSELNDLSMIVAQEQFNRDFSGDLNEAQNNFQAPEDIL